MSNGGSREDGTGGIADAPADVVFFEDAAAWRAWLAGHHTSAREILVGFRKKGSGLPSLTWPQSVDEALCHGWIDGVRKRIDDTSYLIRFTPRKPASVWSNVNVKRFTELSEAGLVTPAGQAAFAARSAERSGVYAYEAEQPGALPPGYEELFRAVPQAWAYFTGQAPSYQRTAVHWVLRAKRPETSERRLRALIEASERGERAAPFSYGRSARGSGSASDDGSPAGGGARED